MRHIMMPSVFCVAAVLLSGCAVSVDPEPISEVSQMNVPPPEGCGGWVTRTQGFWKNHPCVVKGEATGYDLLPLMLGDHQLFSKAAQVEDYLGTPTQGNKQLILGHQLLAAKLNVAAFAIGDYEFADWDSDGVNETVSELTAIADVLFDSGSAADQVKMSAILDKLNNSGHNEPLCFSPTCK